jgi:hypothetical protein
MGRLGCKYEEVESGRGKGRQNVYVVLGFIRVIGNMLRGKYMDSGINIY